MGLTPIKCQVIILKIIEKHSQTVDLAWIISSICRRRLFPRRVALTASPLICMSWVHRCQTFALHLLWVLHDTKKNIQKKTNILLRAHDVCVSDVPLNWIVILNYIAGMTIYINSRDDHLIVPVVWHNDKDHLALLSHCISPYSSIPGSNNLHLREMHEPRPP